MYAFIDTRYYRYEYTEPPEKRYRIDPIFIALRIWQNIAMTRNFGNISKIIIRTKITPTLMVDSTLRV